MTNRVRKGNDVRIRWRVDRLGEPVNLEECSIKVELIDRFRRSVPVTFSVEGNVVIIDFAAANQKTNGVHTAVLIVSDGYTTNTVDECNIIDLVEHSCEESCLDVDAEGMVWIDVASNLVFPANGKDGIGIDSIIQTESSMESEGVNRIEITLTNGEKASFEVRNGSSGYTPQKGKDYFDGKSLYDLLVEAGLFTGPLEEFLAAYEKAAQANAEATKSADEAARTANAAATNATNAAGSANAAATNATNAAQEAKTKTQEALDKVDQAQVIVNAEKLTALGLKVDEHTLILNGVIVDKIILHDEDRTYNQIPANTSSIIKISNLENLVKGDVVKIELSNDIENVLSTWNYYVEGTTPSIVGTSNKNIEITLSADCSEVYLTARNNQFVGTGTFHIKIYVIKSKAVSTGLVNRVEVIEEYLEDIPSRKETEETISSVKDELGGNIAKVDNKIEGVPSYVVSLADADRTYSAIPAGTSNIVKLTNIELKKGNKVRFIVTNTEGILSTWNYYVEGTTPSIVGTSNSITEVELKENSALVYLTARSNQFVGIGTLHYKIEYITLPSAGLRERVENLESGSFGIFETVREAVEQKKTGLICAGENIVVGHKVLAENCTAKDIEENYVCTLPRPKFPMVKSVELNRLYDDAGNMLYICNHSDKHIFYSICPTDTKHVTFESFEQYNSNYFYYAEKNTPSTLHKVTLPSVFGSYNMNRRIKFIFEMTNGDCLVEIENGAKFNAQNGHNNLFLVKNIFTKSIIETSDISFSLGFDVRNERISAFDQIVEYKRGYIVLAPYGSKESAKVYLTKDYGNTWELIFCGDVNNTTHYIKPKAQHLGDANAFGEYPTSELVVAETPLDWSGTGNGNIHIHGITYDKWYDRIWICTGDCENYLDGVTGIWWTDDEGYTWKRVSKRIIGSQMMGVIPMEHCVLFSTDGNGDGYYRWSRNGKDTFIKIENCFNYLGIKTNLVIVAGRSIVTRNGFVLASFAPNNESQGDWSNKGGIVATPNGFDFEIIYEDEFSQGNFETAEIGWSCDITDTGSALILKADKGGYIMLNY